eukprot:1435434-Prymnesium_polylepis.1
MAVSPQAEGDGTNGGGGRACSSASSICWSLRCSILRPSCVSISGSSTPPVGTRVALTVIAPCARPPLKSSTR